MQLRYTIKPKHVEILNILNAILHEDQTHSRASGTRWNELKARSSNNTCRRWYSLLNRLPWTHHLWYVLGKDHTRGFSQLVERKLLKTPIISAGQHFLRNSIAIVPRLSHALFPRCPHSKIWAMWITQSEKAVIYGRVSATPIQPEWTVENSENSTHKPCIYSIQSCDECFFLCGNVILQITVG